jgi:uncharacterized protein
MNVAVIGASDNPGRYSYMAVKLLQEKGHTVFPVHQRVKEIDGLKVYPSVKEISAKIDTVSMYVAADISTKLAGDILAMKPWRIIFNPGAENPGLERQANDHGIKIFNACTLVMLKTGKF